MLRRLPQSCAALPQRTGQFRFQTLQLRNLGPDDAELLCDQIPNVLADLMGMTLDRKQLTDFVEGKPELGSIRDRQLPALHKVDSRPESAPVAAAALTFHRSG